MTKLKPATGEIEQDFISRFMSDSSMLVEFPDDEARTGEAKLAWGQVAAVENSGNWPKSLKCSFIEPGVVNYADVGMVLVRKDVLDKMANSFIGKPIVNAEHRSVSADEFKNGKADGIINRVWFEPADAMFHAEYQVWDQPTLKNIRDGHQVSCAYNVTRWGPGGVHNNVPYDREVLDGEYTHLAIVPNPRYESVRIYNTKGAANMTLKWIKKLLGADGKEMENSMDIESTKSMIVVDGKEYSLDNAVAALKEQEEAAKKAEDLKNSQPKDDDIIDIGDGRKATVKEMKAAIVLKNARDKAEAERKATEEAAAATERRNAEEKEKEDKDHKDGKHDSDVKENCAMCNERKNQSGREHFERINAVGNSRRGDGVADDIPEPFDAIAEGSKRFGSTPADKK